MWSAEGVRLCYLAFGWLKPILIDRWILLSLGGVRLAVIIYVVDFSKLADKSIRLINNLAGDKICHLAFQEWRSYPLVIVMISLGIFLRMYSPIPKPLLGVMYIRIRQLVPCESPLFLKTYLGVGHRWCTELTAVSIG
ncbi:hypothetical protein ACFLV7_15580 [Chloroflexota bacterium]